ncbi:TPA: cytochrome c1 [Legionella pneumophila]|uniref:cytochrome c1 n=1 Tax=Legionella pneumophila TaxID=446 RepID=UPI001374EB16|nr:cytochrome c1 [Legionella pneumophila]HAT2146913.1 cytochrome c1 [Legionella pneumophila]HAT2150016.1 cytochrome c1 [Legionella pneumophila]HAT3883797.1 cytochrome c1 [Legionella pneumophila]HAT8335130.1 cytochrome c1 [Legionella pneumophila]HAT8729754.1 cytochrome c1 [Legionella pneumophila]
MMKIKVLLVAALAFLMSNAAFTENLTMDSVPVDINDKESLQRGAKMFMNYCSGCHSLKYMRYNRMAQDLGLTTFDGQIAENLLKNNLIFTQATIYDPIQIAMSPEDAKQWFGMVPPDLSLSARDRGPVWIYNYLKSFYSDPSRPFGANNLLMPDVAMPNVLEPLIGKVILVKDKNSHANSLLVVKRGEMFEGQFDSALKDLVNFLVYVGEPAKLIRYKLGVFVLLFFCIFLIAAYSLKKAYWKQLK